MPRLHKIEITIVDHEGCCDLRDWLNHGMEHQPGRILRMFSKFVDIEEELYEELEASDTLDGWVEDYI